MPKKHSLCHCIVNPTQPISTRVFKKVLERERVRLKVGFSNPGREKVSLAYQYVFIATSHCMLKILSFFKFELNLLVSWFVWLNLVICDDPLQFTWNWIFKDLIFIVFWIGVCENVGKERAWSVKISSCEKRILEFEVTLIQYESYCWDLYLVNKWSEW